MIVWDSGLADAMTHNALDREHWHRHLADKLPDQLRFYRCLPAASLGRDQIIHHELRTEYCERHQIPWVRRLSGGNTLYLDEQQLCWSQLLTIDTPASTETLLEQHAQAVIGGLRSLGIEHAVWHWPNNIEIHGRRIATLSCTWQDTTLLLQGSLLLHVDMRTTLSVLRVPSEKLSADGLSAARDHVITLTELLNTAPDIDQLCRAIAQALLPDEIIDTIHLAPAQPSTDVMAEAIKAAHALDWRDERNDTIEALWNTHGGLLRARAQFDTEGTTCLWLEIGGDVHTHPADVLHDLSRRLHAVSCHQLTAHAKEQCSTPMTEMVGFTHQDIVHLLHNLLDKLSLRTQSHLDDQTLNNLMLHNPNGQTACEILHDASVMLVPYCAKPAWCKWRHRDGCPECGKCEVGDAYRLARERHMQVFTIMRYEHLVATLKQLKEANTAAYIGMCCSNFFIKRHRAFAEAGMPALLLDISGSNCYELQQEDLAYAGQFEAKAQLDMVALQQVIRFCPSPSTPNAPEQST